MLPAPEAVPTVERPAPAPRGVDLGDEVVAGADADPCVTRVRQALADSGAEADVVVLDHAPRSPEDLADELGVPLGALVRCHLLLVEAADLTAPSATSYGGGLDEPSDPVPAAGDGDPARAVLVLAARERRLLAADVAEAVAGLGVDGVRHATEGEVRALTGCSTQDLPPTGLPGDCVDVEAVLVDTALGDHAVLWAPAGRPGTALSTSYGELLRITLGHPVALS
ncbi:YbaK/EbsC family protein [uncultured Pseudokineococcus sp.]|uniref:YbaK/EbsC family protein n=1 Tax=uncultured Pseudokineococcus sp. TaxID=1642928 RepID=UPI0026330E7A|nr:YbaK/EbsC family protein [uncultured Pseudokineococcus sp.]